MIIKPKNQEITEDNIYLIAEVIKQKSLVSKVFVLTEDQKKNIIYEFTIIKSVENPGNYKISYFDGKEPRTLKTSDEVFTD